MNKRLSCFILSAFAIALWAPAVADGHGEEKAKAEVDYSKMSTGKLRKASEKAAEDFYGLFSELNDEDEFDVRCYQERPTGSRRKFHTCKPEYLYRIQTGHAARNWDNRMDSAGNNVETETAAKSAEFEKRLAALVAENAELQAKLQHYNELQALLAERGNRKK